MLHRTPLADLLAETPQRVGRRWVWSDGTSVPYVAGGNGEAGPPADPPAGDPPKPPAGDPAAGGNGPAGQGAAPTNAGAGLTQADLDKAKREAKKAAIAEVAATLGCTVEEAKALVDAKKAADDQQKTETQRLLDAAQERERKADERERATARKEQALDLRLALVSAKIADDRLDKAAKLLLADLADDADEDAIKAAVETFKTETPEWFGEAKPPPPGSDPQGRGPSGGAGGAKTGMDAGRQRAIDRRANQPADAADPLGAFARI
jgi:hypothetical protein